MKKTTIRPTKDMTDNDNSREQMLALLQGDDAIRALLQTTVQEVLEAEMDLALGAERGERCAKPPALPPPMPPSPACRPPAPP